MEHKGSRSRKEKDEQRMRSKKSREEKERERQEKAREREMQKVEKEQVKLEKERVRIEKERIRAMERQAKLERMKGRLSQFDTDSTQPPSSPAPTSANPAQDAAALQKVTSDFQRKLEEWEFTLGPPSGQERPPPLSLQPCLDSPEERSPVDRTSDVSLGDDSTSVTEENLTKTNITSLERANSQLLQEVQRKEQEYSALQEDVQKLNSKLEKVRQEHASEMARFKRELEAGEVSGPVQVDVSDLEQTMRELEERIVMMETAGDQLAESMESAAIGKWQSIEGEEAVSGQLVDMVEQMKSMLVQASQTQKQSEKSLALHNFEQVYSHAMKLQVQMNNLRVSQLERNKEIMLIKRQLLLQEVNNVLLQAHITRRETELYQYREARRHANVRRWNTFSTSDNRVPLGPGDARPPLLRNVSLQEGDQPQQQAASDEAVSIPAAGVGPEPVVTKEGATVTKPTTTTTTASSATTTTTATTTKPSELATDHMEQHMASPIAETTTTEEKKTGAATPASGAVTSATVAAGPSLAATSPTPADTAKQTKTSTSEASKVETGSPTLLAQTTANGSAKVPADTTEPPSATTKTETPDLPDIPKGPDTGEEPTLPSQSAPQVDDNYSPTESVMECTKSAVDRDTDGAQGTGTGPEAAVGGVDISSREQQQTQPKAVRSPVSKAKYLRRQKEEREKHKEKKAASPKSPHRDSASGKPPLPRPSTPHSPGSSQRSKSVGDMDGIEPNGANAEPPLKQVIERFEKRATVCETEERKIEFRKTPSPTLHLPRVGLVSRVRRLKPAAELLEESQRYRSGHSIYATRIMHRYLPAQAAKLPGSGTGTPTPAASSTPAGSSQDKENISGTSYVQAIVKRLSREFPWPEP
nr:hypothetical protein BaRGS_027357 [Batillaria attramentaria]